MTERKRTCVIKQKETSEIAFWLIQRMLHGIILCLTFHLSILYTKTSILLYSWSFHRSPNLESHQEREAGWGRILEFFYQPYLSNEAREEHERSLFSGATPSQGLLCYYWVKIKTKILLLYFKIYHKLFDITSIRLCLSLPLIMGQP